MPAYFPENNTAQYGDTAERSLQKISDLLKNGDIPIKINSVDVTGPFTVNNEVEITNDTGSPLPVAGVDPISGEKFALQLTPEKRLKVDSGPAPDFVGVFNAPSSSTVSDVIPINGYPAGTVFLFEALWGGGANQTWKLQTGTVTQPGTFAGAVDRSVYDAFKAVKGPSQTQIGPAATSFLYRKGANDGSHLRFSRTAGTPTSLPIKVYAYDELDFGTGYPHVGSISSLVYDVDENLKVSDFQMQSRLGNTSDAAADNDGGTFSLFSLLKRLLDRLSNGVINKLPALGQTNMAGSISVTVASNQSALPVSGTVAVSNAFATESTLSTLNNKIPSSLTVSSTRLLVDPGSISISSGQSVGVTNTETSRLYVRPSNGSLSVTARTASTTSEEVLPAVTDRRYLLIQNLSTAAIVVNFGSPATTTGIRLDAGSSLSFEGLFVPINSINVRGTQEGLSFIVVVG